jgi:predicted  nucleic acid-binding Zn-ribbon protein
MRNYKIEIENLKDQINKLNKSFEQINDELTENMENMKKAHELVLEVTVEIQSDSADLFSVMKKLAEIRELLS